MQNNVTECWFYQLCKKECAKDVGLIFVGIWKSFGTTYQQLIDEINAHKLAMAQAVQG